MLWAVRAAAAATAATTTAVRMAPVAAAGWLQARRVAGYATDAKAAAKAPAQKAQQQQRSTGAAAASSQRGGAAAASASATTTAAAPVFTPTALKTDLLRTLNLEEMHRRVKERGQDIPTFHSGSTLRIQHVESLDTPRMLSFTGICISKVNRGLGSSVILRNVIDGVSVERRFELFSPLVKKIEVLELARRRRAKLYYLRDRPQKESQINVNMEALPLPAGKVPIRRPRV
eukprot:m.212890 g.212890  ORF g.212890 m.212890 type:complete len:231 (+) comp21826_c0_seq1:100-792(+)